MSLGSPPPPADSPSPGKGMALRPPENVEQAALWLAGVIQWAHERGVTDLHLFPAEGESVLWARLDGQLHDVTRYSNAVHQRVIARLKVLGRCADYSGELVLEGRFSLNGRPEEGEARLSILPTLRGEKAVIRLLTGGTRLRRLGELGFHEALEAVLRKTMDRPQGLLLAVGPSGCGKSTALYALLRDLHERTPHPVSTVTIEDPVEQSLPCTAQISVEPARGLNFAEGLRAVLRQDPEVIMIGEIRDAETASAALHAALTGHRLISSMHTLSAAEALVRLRQMGSPPYVIASALAGVLNLRLARLLCPHCKRRRALKPEEQEVFPESREWPEGVVYESAGCETCLGSGRLGRTGVGEWLTPTADTSAALQANQPTLVLARTLEIAVSARPAAVALLRDGRISLEEWESLTGLASLATH